MTKFNLEDIKKLIFLPLNDLIFKAQNTHKKHFKTTDFQLASLMSIKTGSCPEDCKYCPQSAHFNVNLKKEKLVEVSKFNFHDYGSTYENLPLTGIFEIDSRHQYGKIWETEPPALVYEWAVHF